MTIRKSPETSIRGEASLLSRMLQSILEVTGLRMINRLTLRPAAALGVVVFALVGAICVDPDAAYSRDTASSAATNASDTAQAKPPSKSGAMDASKKDSTGSSDGPFGDLAGNKNRGPIAIQSDTMTLDYKGNAVLFAGNVHAKQADGDLWTNSLNVKYGKDFHEVQEMFAEGNVRMSQGQRFCTSDHGVMNQAAHTVVLTGTPVCHDDKDQISGDKIIVHLDTGKSDVLGQVKATIFPHDEKNRDNEVPAGNSN